jgi:hypothetical protein
LDFFTTQTPPFVINIDGKAFQLPRFLGPAFIALSAKLKKERVDEAMAELGDHTAEERARFRTFWQSPPMDTRFVAQYALSPEGTAYVVDHCLAKAGVAEADRKRVLEENDPLLLRNLADELTFAARLNERLKIEGEDASPLPESPVASSGSPATGGPITGDSSAPTATSTAA